MGYQLTGSFTIAQTDNIDRRGDRQGHPGRLPSGEMVRSAGDKRNCKQGERTGIER